MIIVTCCQGKEVLKSPYEEGEEFSLSYEMSLYKVDQSEHFYINKDNLYLKEVFFGSYEAYDYYEASSNNDLVYLGDDNYLLKNINFYMGSIVFRNAHYSDHEIKIDEKTHNIGNLAPKGEVIKIKIEKNSILNKLKRRFSN